MARAAMIGGALAVATLPGHLLVDGETSQVGLALTLAAVAAIYVGFALADGRTKILAVEAVTALVFASAAALSLLLSAWVGVAAFALHALWDLAHHRHVDTVMPRWYIPFCAVFDLVFAAGMTAILIMSGKG